VKAKPKHSDSDFFALRILTYTHNPKAANKGFPYPEQNKKTIDYSIKPQSKDEFDPLEFANSSEISIAERLEMEFKKAKKEAKSLCLSEKLSEWTQTNCITTPSDESVNCGCDELSIFTVIDDVKGMFTESRDVFN
jgi:hypothetical protein